MKSETPEGKIGKNNKPEPQKTFLFLKLNNQSQRSTFGNSYQVYQAYSIAASDEPELRKRRKMKRVII